MGKILSDYRKGFRPKFDERNRLIIPTMNIIRELQPKWIIFENVANMADTLILNEKEELINIIDYIISELGSNYIGKAEVIDCADYGVPQHRKRLLTIFSCTDNAKNHFANFKRFLPNQTHFPQSSIFTPVWRTVRDAIAHLPLLSSTPCRNFDINYHPLHKVPLLDEKKLLWIENTPEGNSAFNNQCINPKCLFQDNPTHGATRDHDGINRYNGDTPIYCQKCGHILPRPWVEDKKPAIKD